MPLAFATSAMVSPARALQALPSMVISLMRCFSHNGLAMGQASALETRLPQVEVRDEFFVPVDSLLVELTEILKGRKDRIGRRLPEPAPAQGADILAPGLGAPPVDRSSNANLRRKSCRERQVPEGPPTWTA